MQQLTPHKLRVWKQTFTTCIVFLLFSTFIHSKSVDYFVKTLEGSTNNFDIVEAKNVYLSAPTGLCLGINDDLFVSDVARHLVFRIFDNFSQVEVYAGYVMSGFNGDGLPALGTLLNTPTAISINPLNGDLYIADTLNDKIRIVSNTTKTVSSISSSTFNRPAGVYVSSNGFVYIADTQNNLIKKYEISTQQVSTIGGGGYLSGDYDGVDAKLLKLQLPKNIHVVSNGKKDIVYFTDDERVKSIDENGIYRMVDNGVPQSNLFGIFVSNQGEIYTSSQTKHFVQMKLAKSSQTQLYFGSSSYESGYSGDNQFNSSNVNFYGPSSLVVTQNSILLADKSNNCIRKINLQNMVVSTLAGGIINHPYGENISPLKMYTYGTTLFPFVYNNDFYFVEKELILRKVSNGKMTTVLGCATTLTYNADMPQRTYMSIQALSYLGNGDVVILNSNYLFYHLNLDTQKLSYVAHFRDHVYSFATIGNSFQNATIYYRYSLDYVIAFQLSNATSNYILNIPSLGTVYDMNVVMDLRFSGTNSIFYYSNTYNTIYEYIDYKNGSVSTYSNRVMPINSGYGGFSRYDKFLYFWNAAQLYEMEIEPFSFRKIAGFEPYNVSNTIVYVGGFNGEDIPLNTSVLNFPRATRTGPKIYVTNLYSISEISNDRIFTVAGSTSISKTITPVSIMRDPVKKISYYLDSRTLKKFDEITGMSSSLTTSIISFSNNPIDTPFFMMGPTTTKTFSFFSTFDRKIYIKDTCRILRFDPETLNFETIIGKACTTLVAGVKGLDSGCPLTILVYGMTFDQSNGDVLISLISTVFRYNLQTQLLSLEFQFSGSSATPDGIVTNRTGVGSITNLRHQNGFLYFSTNIAIRRIEKLSNGSYYLRTIVGNSQQGYSGDNLPALESSLDNPSSFYVKNNGDIIILDGTYIVRMYQQQTGLLIDIAGSRTTSTTAYNGDGYVPYPNFSYFSKQVEFDESTGDIFFIDGQTYLRKITPTCRGNYTLNSINGTCDLLISCNGSLTTSESVCNGNGVCSDFETCQCKDGFEGRYCEIRKSSADSSILIVAIVIPIVGVLLILIFLIVLIIMVMVCVNRKKKKKENIEIGKIETNVELSDDAFFSKSSMIISSSAGSSLGSEKEDPLSRYTNIIRIGQGAFGSIFKVNDSKNSNKLKAIKLVRFESLTDLNTVMKEASQLSHVNHPNIIKMNDYFITNDNLLIIDMDYYEMGDLAQLKPEFCTEKLIKQILKQTLSALIYVHEEMHIIHRDIKPTNIFIKKLTSNDIEVVLADFGLAKKYQESKGQSYAGTPLYMSPEVALGSSYTFNTDIFSLGVSIYQVMTNDKLTSISNLLMGNQSENGSKILRNQMKESSSQKYSEELIEVILKMVEKDANTRLSATQLLSLKYFN